MTGAGPITIRIRYAKAGRVRFVSHRDVARLFERALRKLRLPVAYTEGFSPRPKLSFGLALTVAHESEAEYLDVELTESIDLETLPDRLTAALPPGITVDAAVAIEPGTASLQQAIVCCDWHIEVLGATCAEIESAVADVLAATALPQERVRKGKTAVADVRPAILGIEVRGPTCDGVDVWARLATESVSLRPAELVRVLGGDLDEGRVRRTHQWMIVDGARCEPVKPPGPSTRHGQLRAS
ncbi:MAG: TIGR03936 family radical SAM-associated protein [Acidimicrobiales bacterium]